MTDVYDVLDEAFPMAVASTPLGVELRHEHKIILRVERGSGIAGRGDIWAVTFPGHPDIAPVCGIRTRSELKAALRDRILIMFEWGQAILKASRLP